MSRFPLVAAAALAMLPLAPAHAQEATPVPEPSPAVTTPVMPSAIPQGAVLPLSLDEAVKRALDNNVDIAVDKYNPELSEESIRQAQGYYEPVVTSTVS